jgi:hypothetical protein
VVQHGYLAPLPVTPGRNFKSRLRPASAGRMFQKTG